MGAAGTGILLTLCVGLLWSLVGVWYKAIAKWNLSVFNISLVTGMISLLVTLCFVSRTIPLVTGSLPLPGWGYALFMVTAGLLNSGGCIILQRSMACGNSSVSWAIGQSAFIVPFLSVTLIFSEPWIPAKVIGCIFVVIGMACAALRPAGKKTETEQTLKSLRLAFLSFFVIGCGQSMFSGASFFPAGDPGSTRPLLVTAGALLAAGAGKILLHDKGFSFNQKALSLVGMMALQGVLTLVLQFLALDRLRECGMNGIFFPVAIGVCIAGYALWSVLLYREKCAKIFFAGLMLILTGVGFFCYSAA